MPGGVMQLVSVGAQDQFITGAPEISWFKLVYKRHTNFSMESVRQTFNTKPVIEKSSRNIYTCKINRVADLLQEIYFAYQLPTIYSSAKFRFRWIDNISQYIIYSCSVRIDNQIIDQLWGDWMDVWNELSLTSDKKEAYDKMTANVDDFNNPRLEQAFQYINNNNIELSYYPPGTSLDNPSIKGRRIYLPLGFWFTKNPGLALPLIALQYQNIEVTVELRSIGELYRIYDERTGIYFSPDEFSTENISDRSLISKINNDSNNDVSIERFLVPIGESYATVPNSIDIDGYLECNYIFLDEPERKAMAINSHDFLIQRPYRIEQSTLKGSRTIDLMIQNPIKELIWIARRSDMRRYNNWNNFTNFRFSAPNYNILLTTKLLWNGMERFEDKPPEYFNYIQPFQHHSRCPREGIHCYSFAIYPEKLQPSGSFNASTINKIQLYLSTIMPDPVTITSRQTYSYTYDFDFIIYALHYNIFRIMSGSGGMVFAN